VNNINHIILLAISLLITACDSDSQRGAQTSLDSENSAIQVIDFNGNTVSLAAPAERVIALAPHVVENIFSAGAGDKLIGVVQYSDFPEQAKSLPIVGGYEKTNHEKIVELDPDLIIAWESGNSHASLTRLTELGYTVYVDQPDTLADVAKSIKDIGILTGRTAVARPAAENYLAQLAKFKFKYKNAPKVSAFYQVWNQPLQTINGKHIISDAIETCGGMNVYADEFAVAPVINVESILERDPQAIIASGMSDSRPDWLNDWRKWPSLTAVQKDNLFFVDPDHIQRHTTRILLGIESICAQLDLARNKAANGK